MLLILLVVIVVIGVLMFNRRKGFASNGEVFSLAEMLQGSLFKLSLECEEIIRNPYVGSIQPDLQERVQAQLLRMSYYEKKHFI